MSTRRRSRPPRGAAWVLRLWRLHFLGIESGVAAVASLILLAWVLKTNQLPAFLQGNRGAFYGTVASIEGALLGFVIATVTIVMGFSSSPQFAIVRGSPHYQTLWLVFSSAIRALGIATAATLVALLLDRDTGHNVWAMMACLGSGIWAGLRVWRVVWVLEKSVSVVVGT